MSINISKTDNEFEMTVKGHEFVSLPNFRIVVPPLIDVGLHDFRYANPEWVLQVSHTQAYKGAQPRPPRMKLFVPGSDKCFTFLMPHRDIYKEFIEVLEDLRKAKFDLKSIACKSRMFIHDTATAVEYNPLTKRYEAIGTQTALSIEPAQETLIDRWRRERSEKLTANEAAFAEPEVMPQEDGGIVNLGNVYTGEIKQ